MSLKLPEILFDQIVCHRVKIESRIAHVSRLQFLNLLCHPVEDFISEPFGVGTSGPHEDFSEVGAELDIDSAGQLTIGIEPGENFLKTFRWDCRTSGHVRVISV